MENAIIGINPDTRICEEVALATDKQARQNMLQSGLVIGETTTDVARKLLGEKVEITAPYAFAN
ncbi:hypothetical protein [Deefgea piscis]|uniref:hypothetical protein n=1 Tax=Deefgea piscis TaxID=2739061 RepID=UPI001C80252A|nr:hypothetical protein [Deefgea piscis]QZA80218.1 hypothetical protein K4H25_11810 [Deefgea piscis]